jgi:hypothetical protein
VTGARWEVRAVGDMAYMHDQLEGSVTRQSVTMAEYGCPQNGNIYLPLNASCYIGPRLIGCVNIGKKEKDVYKISSLHLR